MNEMFEKAKRYIFIFSLRVLTQIKRKGYLLKGLRDPMKLRILILIGMAEKDWRLLIGLGVLVILGI